MNIFFAILIIFIILYILLNWFAKTSTKKISKFVRTFIIISSILLAVIMAYAGRYIFSLPFMLAILPLIKTKAGISLFQLFRLWGLFRVLKNSGRFNFNQFNQNMSSQNMSLDEAYRILNLDPKKKYTKMKQLNITRNQKKIVKPFQQFSKKKIFFHNVNLILKKIKVFKPIILRSWMKKAK